MPGRLDQIFQIAVISVQVWLRSVQRSQRLGVEKKERKKKERKSHNSKIKTLLASRCRAG